jgi:molybdopterin adenylyltransferase
MRVSVITISDSVSTGKSEDRSGPAVAARCKELGWEIVSSKVSPDDHAAIQTLLEDISDATDADVILTTGGTGVGPRDVTPEATMAVAERLIPGGSQENSSRNFIARCCRNSRHNHHH